MLIETMKKLNEFSGDLPATEDEIADAENIINVVFADDYRKYLLNFRTMSAYGVELTGICPVKWLNVADVTLYAREEYNLPEEYYVIENLHINDILAIQNSEGTVFLFRNGVVKEEANSLEEYLLKISQ